ncbi:hypothetical protein P4O66_013499 [Electrophorus voltai]|uniref:Uncharacterized protein n=1 Tax=Electrophorus voltai TaxID=2609070 RepID=A0AAD8Z2K1_9TELE|nr:hypothetical protein P4O66_013499 [Electrophorus voltai]
MPSFCGVREKSLCVEPNSLLPFPSDTRGRSAGTLRCPLSSTRVRRVTQREDKKKPRGTNASPSLHTQPSQPALRPRKRRHLSVADAHCSNPAPPADGLLRPPFPTAHLVSTDTAELEPATVEKYYGAPARLTDREVCQSYESSRRKAALQLRNEVIIVHQLTAGQGEGGGEAHTLEKVHTPRNPTTHRAVSCVHQELERQNCMSLPIFSTTVESPDPPALQSIPQLYRAFSDVFSKVKAIKLPPHRSSDCAVELLPGAPLPRRSKPYPLRQPEEAAMETYVTEALQRGFIRSSTSPVAAGFFFVEKKGGLRPCIDYWTLNKVTVKYSYPLPLISLTHE